MFGRTVECQHHKGSAISHALNSEKQKVKLRIQSHYKAHHKQQGKEDGHETAKGLPAEEIKRHITITWAKQIKTEYELLKVTFRNPLTAIKVLIVTCVLELDCSMALAIKYTIALTYDAHGNDKVIVNHICR